jgi:hypothetical protein
VLITGILAVERESSGRRPPRRDATLARTSKAFDRSGATRLPIVEGESEGFRKQRGNQVKQVRGIRPIWQCLDAETGERGLAVSLLTVVLSVALAAIALSALVLLFALALARSAADSDRHMQAALAKLSEERLCALADPAPVEIQARRLQPLAPPQLMRPASTPPPWQRDPPRPLSRRRTWRQPSSA